MSFFRKVLLGTGVVLLLTVLVGFFLPSHVRVERAVTITRPRPAVFAILNGFHEFNSWSPWAALDPNAKYTFEGPASGVGAVMNWVGDPATMGSGSQRIVVSDPGTRVQVDIAFGAQARGLMSYTLADDGTGTRVVLSLDSDLGWNPFARYFGLMFDRMIGGDFERGLAQLKKYAEARPASN
jgi:hypothetical protein